MPSMKHLIDCPGCEGSGKVELHEHLRETLDWIPSRGATSAYELLNEHPHVGQPSAFNNRLERLRGLGLVTRQRHGKTWLYSRAIAATKKGNK